MTQPPTPETAKGFIVRTLVERDGRDPQTTLELIPRGDGVLAGVQEIASLMHSTHAGPFQL